MNKVLLISIGLCVLCTNVLRAQKKIGKLKNDTPHTQSIKISTYHQYELKLKKGTVALLNLTEFDIQTELTVVSPKGMIVEKTNTAGTADFLVFEAPASATYQFYINVIDDEKNLGTYTLTAHYIPKRKSGKLDQIKELLQLLEKPSRAGMVTGIVENGNILFEHVMGYANVEHRLKNTNETVFELASVSKQFTAMAIAKLAEEGKLSVQDDIRTYFPELPIYKSPIQIKHLLNHSAGIIDSGFPLDLAGFEKDPIELERVLNFLQKTPEQYFETGTAFEYSNDAYTLLGELVHRVTKQDFRSWMKQNVFDPLNMKSSLIRDSPEIVIPNRATSYVSYTGDTHFRRLSFDFYAPGGCSVRSNLNDLATWVDYLNKGYHSKEKLFKRVNTVEQFPNGEAMEYAYGNFVTKFRGLKRFSHLGLSAGFTTAIARFPEQNLGFIVLGNDGEFRNYYLSRKIYEIYLEDQLTPFSKVFEGIETKKPNNEKPDQKHTILKDLNLKAYEGSFFSQQINTNYTFQVKKDTLFALSAAYAPIPIIEGVIDTLKTDKDFMERIIFKRDFNGEISECVIYSDDDNHGIAFTKIPSEKKWTTPTNWKSNVFKQKMRDTLKRIEASKILPGFSVSVFNESEIFLQEGYGYADIATKKKYGAETIQLIASISKSITGMSVIKAMEMGFFKLDDPINDHLPFKITNPNFPEDLITIRHLLTHTSSLNDTENYRRNYVFRKSLKEENWPKAHHKRLFLYNNNVKLPLSDFLDEVISPKGKWYNQVEMYTKERPGTSYEYSNMGFALLGYIIEITTKMDFKNFTQKHIFDPLDMTSSTWELESIDANQHTTYYIENYEACPDYSINTIPEGGLYTSIIDLTKFLQEAIRGYAGRGKILSQSSYKEMFSSQTNLVEIDEGLGWDLSFSCCIGHGGNDFGASTVMYFEPRTGIGRIVFANISAETEEISSTFYGIMNKLFQVED